MAEAEGVSGVGEAGRGGRQAERASRTTVFLLRPTGSHGKQLNWVGLHVVTDIFTRTLAAGEGWRGEVRQGGHRWPPSQGK